MSALSDTQIIRGSLARPAMFGLLFDRHAVAVLRFARHNVGVEAGDDVAAETFIRAFASRERYVPRTSDARAWLFAIATNLVRDERRRRTRVVGLEDRLVGSLPADTAVDAVFPDPELHAALVALREEEREVLVLFAWAELSYEEIAEATGVPIGTVRSRLSRARSRLKERLAGAPCTSTMGGS